MDLDDKDLRILQTLNKNSRLSTYQLSKQTGIPVTTVHNRLKRLEDNKVIRAYTIDVDYKTVHRDVVVYILMTYDMNEMEKAGLNTESLSKIIWKIPEVEDVSFVTGRFDLILKIRLESIRTLSTLVLDKIRKVPGIKRTETSYALFHESRRRI
jgi:Lrp/AsnC family transcriptional regulator for asnA, asnC and gidA